VGDQHIGSPGMPISSGLQGPGEEVQKQDPPLVNFPRRFSFKMSSIAPAETSNTPR